MAGDESAISRARADFPSAVRSARFAIPAALLTAGFAAYGATLPPDAKLWEQLVFAVAGSLGGALLLGLLAFVILVATAPVRQRREILAGVVSDVEDIRRELAQIRQRDRPKPPRIVDVRLTVLNLVRRAKVLQATPALGPYSDEHSQANDWVDGATRFLSKFVSSEAAEGFLRASGKTGHAALPAQIEFLEHLVASGDLPTDLRVPADG